jgi:hypothetical protein
MLTTWKVTVKQETNFHRRCLLRQLVMLLPHTLVVQSATFNDRQPGGRLLAEHNRTQPTAQQSSEQARSTAQHTKWCAHQSAAKNSGV